MKRIQRFAQRTTEAFGIGDKSDKLTVKLAEVEKKVEGIRNGCLVVTKKLSGTFVGSGSTLEKHQKRIPQYTLGMAMMESGAALEGHSLFGSIMEMVGQVQIDIAGQMSQYEISVMHDIIQELNTMIEEDWKKVEKAKKKLNNARLDMDAAKTRLKSHEAHLEKATREYNMEKLQTLQQNVDESTRVFDDAQDTYATEMFDFLSKEQLYTRKIQELVMLQITHYKNAAVHLESMLPRFEKKMNASQLRPVFGVGLDEHLANSKQEIATVLEVCCTALRDHGMDTEGLFRIAAGAAKVKFLKSAFDAGQTDVSAHDSHTIAGCLKMYLRELPEPLLTYDLYPKWMKAAGIGDYDERLQALWSLKEVLPQSNLKNLKYLMAFLYEFSLYSDLTKMTVNNIAIVIGPNLLWPREESADPLNMVTDTQLQRRIAELLIEHCHWMFPDLPEPQQPTLPSTKSSYLPSLSSSHSLSSQGLPPLSPRGTSDSVSITSTGSSGSGGSPAPLPPSTTRAKERPPDRDLPHPLADNPALEGVAVLVMDNKVSPTDATPSPKTRKLPPPVAPYKTVVPPSPHSGVTKANTTDPPSPIPKPRHNSAGANQNLGINRTPSSDTPTENGEPNARPTPPARTKKAHSDAPPPTAAKPKPPSGATPTKLPPGATPPKPSPSGRGGPIRKAPPPPVSKKPGQPPPPPTEQENDEVSAL